MTNANQNKILRDLQARTLELLSPGESLRFVFARGPRDSIRFQLEAESSDLMNSHLEIRLGVAFKALREAGYLFEQQSTPATSRRTSAAKRQQMYSIQPQFDDAMSLRGRTLGFNPRTGLAGNRSTPIHIPAFASASLIRTLESPLAWLCRETTATEIHLEFMRCELTLDQIEQVRGMLDQTISETAKLLGFVEEFSVLRAYLTLWLQNRTGWRITLWAVYPYTAKAQCELLEFAGCEIFGAPCRAEKFDGTHSAAGATALGSAADGAWYPRGWSLPLFLPQPGADHELQLASLGNIKVPKLPKQGLLIGTADGLEVRLPDETRDRHTYIVGATGTGKSTLLTRLIMSDIERGEGVILLDPHGDLFNEIRQRIPESRKGDLVTINPASKDKPPGLNVLDIPRDDLFRRRVEVLIGELLRFFEETWSAIPEAFGPAFNLYYRNAMLLLLLQPEVKGCLADIPRVFAEKEFRASLLETCTDKPVRLFWTGVAEKTTGEHSLQNYTPYVTCKFAPLLQGGFISELLNQQKDELLLELSMDVDGILLVNLSKGMIGPLESTLLGRLLTMQIFMGGLKRSIVPQEHRRPVNIYIDEFQNFVSDNIASMLSEARKFGLRLNLANQTLSQLSGYHGHQNLLETVLGNVGNILMFRLGVPATPNLLPLATCRNSRTTTHWFDC
jgi:hypothetical protein